jgi:hypothetical protein
MTTTDSSPSAKGGRPPKFDEPSRPVTVTLPLRVLERLREIDGDRALAIVQAVDAFLGGPLAPVRELPVNDGEALIAISDNRLLRIIPWLSLVKVAPNTHLLSLKSGVPVEKLEVTIGDLIDISADATPAELDLLRQLLERLRTPRRNSTVRSESILVIQHSRPPRA